MRRFLRVAVAVWLACACSEGKNAVPVANKHWRLVWSDEFNGADGSAPDPAKWHLVEWKPAVVNNELQTYTSSRGNVVIHNGKLLLTARKEGAPEHPVYTSARLETEGHFQQMYGRVEALITLPAGGQGIWPAFWMLGADHAETGWPNCGEIDIMEQIGREPDRIHGTIHGPGYSGDKGITAAWVAPESRNLFGTEHLFAVEWEPETIRFYVDGDLYATQTPVQLPLGSRWVYDHPFFLLLDLAVGGNWPGNPDQTTRFPTSMEVDYVRVYTRA